MKPGWTSRSQTCVSPQPARLAARRSRSRTAPSRARRPRTRAPRGPTSATTPHSSWPGTCGSAIVGSWPIQPCQSLTGRRRWRAPRPPRRPARGTGRRTVSIASGCSKAVHDGGAHAPYCRGVAPLGPAARRAARASVTTSGTGSWTAGRRSTSSRRSRRRPGLVARSIAAVPRRAERPADGASTSCSTRSSRAASAPTTRASSPAIGSPSNPVSVLADLIGAGHNVVRRQLDRRRGRVGGRARRARLAARAGWGCRDEHRGRARQRRLGRHAHRARGRRARAASTTATRRPPTCRSTRTRRSPRRGACSASTPRTCASCAPTRRTGCSPPRSTPRCGSTAQAGLRAVRASSARRARRAPARVDPLDDLADLAQREDLWFHVDGAYGAPGRADAHGRDLLTGIERADSLVLDPHKWLFQPYEIGGVLMREPRAARAARSRSTAPTCATPRAAWSSSATAARSSRAARAR